MQLRANSNTRKDRRSRQVHGYTVRQKPQKKAVSPEGEGPFWYPILNSTETAIETFPTTGREGAVQDG